MDFDELGANVKNESMDFELDEPAPGDSGEDPSVKDETIELEKEPKLVLEKVNVSRSRALLTKNKIEQNIFEQVDEVMNEPSTSESDNDSLYETNHSKPRHCRKCDKSYKTESAYKGHLKRYHRGKKRGVKPKEDVFNPWNVSNLDDFLHYCCPECDVRHESRTLFINHAIDEHPKSRHFLSILDLKQDNESFEFGHFEDFGDTEMYEDDLEYSDDEMKNGDFIMLSFIESFDVIMSHQK